MSDKEMLLIAYGAMSAIRKDASHDDAPGFNAVLVMIGDHLFEGK